jgi:transposase-like protein
MDKVQATTHFDNETQGREYLEAQRWPEAPVCPHCAVTGKATRLTPRPHTVGHVRKGLYQCNACRQQFTVTVGTIFEDSRVPLNKWLLAIHLLCTSKTGISVNRLQRSLSVTYKTAWLMVHRVRYALSQESLSKHASKPVPGEPLTLAPLAFRDAVSELLKVKPPAKQPGSDGVEDLVAQMREKRRRRNAR